MARGTRPVTTVIDESVTCAILADRNSALADRLRELLRTTVGTVFTVTDCESLLEGVRRLSPGLVLVDLGFGEQGATQLLREINSVLPTAKLVALSLYDDPVVAQTALAEGASGVVLKRSIGDDLLAAVDTVLAGGTFVSSCFESDADATSPTA